MWRPTRTPWETESTRRAGNAASALQQPDQHSRSNDTLPAKSTIHRTGPLGRLARLVLAGVFALTLLSIVGNDGSARFRNPHILGEPNAWFLHVLMFVLFLMLVGALAEALAGHRARRPWQIGAAVAAVAAVAIAASIGLMSHGSAWGFPLADLVWWFDVLMAVEQLVVFLLAIALGTPGCEIGVWLELLARLRGGLAQRENGLACVAGLHRLDAWEARRERHTN